MLEWCYNYSKFLLLIKGLETKEELKMAHIHLREHQETIEELRRNISQKAAQVTNIQKNLEKSSIELQEKVCLPSFLVPSVLNKWTAPILRWILILILMLLYNLFTCSVWYPHPMTTGGISLHIIFLHISWWNWGIFYMPTLGKKNNVLFISVVSMPGIY